MARLGLPGVLPARALARIAFSGVRARALFAGLAAHSVLPLDAPLTASFGLMFAVATHVANWPLPRGGSQRIADALAARLRSLGGTIETGRHVGSLDEIGAARAYLCDVTPRQLEEIAGPRLSDGYRAKLHSFRYGPGVFSTTRSTARSRGARKTAFAQGRSISEERSTRSPRARPRSHAAFRQSARSSSSDSRASSTRRALPRASTPCGRTATSRTGPHST